VAVSSAWARAPVGSQRPSCWWWPSLMPGAGTVEIDHVKLLVVVGRPVWVKRRSGEMPLIVCSRWLR